MHHIGLKVTAPKPVKGVVIKKRIRRKKSEIPHPAGKGKKKVKEKLVESKSTEDDNPE